MFWLSLVLGLGLLASVIIFFNAKRSYKKTLENLNQQISALQKSLSHQDQWTSMMCHDLRSPLTAVQLRLEMLLADTAPSEAAHVQASAALEALENLISLINDILDSSQTRAGLLKVSPTVSSVSEEVGKVFQTYQPLGEAQGLDFSLHISEDLPSKTLIDVRRLNQVLSNLIDNAIKFTQRGFVRVHVTFDHSANAIQIEIEDSGVGIEEESLPFIFEPYYTAHASLGPKESSDFTPSFNHLRSNFRSTGLGLAVVSAIAKASGWHIQVQSRAPSNSSPNEMTKRATSEINTNTFGSIFTLIIPITNPNGLL
jgi:signal transduction histidine kinase